MSNRRVVLIASALSLLYFVVQLIYIQHLPLVMDEFDGANEAYQLLELTPYRDYAPYKTVLGYYASLPPLLLTDDPWVGVMLSKAWLASINTVVILFSTLSLATIFSPAAALLGQALLIAVSTFLERSSELRVDMLTAWAGLASFVLLLHRRWLAAGVVAGLSFLVSQKGVYYVAAANAAIAIYWLLESRTRQTIRDGIVFNAGVAAALVVYIAFWSALSTPSAVINATFFSHGAIAFSDLYDNLKQHWTRTLTRNPLFYWGALAGLIWLCVARWRRTIQSTHVMAAAYGAAVFALCRWHKQPWPYFFVILIPTLMVVHVATIDVLFRQAKWRPALLAVIALLGIAWPLAYMPGILSRDHRYQQNTIELARAMLDEHETYLAGNDLIYDRHQAHPELRRLSAPRLEAVRQWPQSRIDATIADLERVRPKLVIDDMRMRRLPAPLARYLDTRFDNLWSGVSGYAPLVTSSSEAFDIWFDGRYRVETKGDDVIIDGAPHQTGTVISLRRGPHRIESTVPVRLRLLPERLEEFSDPSLRQARLMFTRAYDY